MSNPSPAIAPATRDGSARCRVLLVSAIAGGGHGKTLVTAALARLHSRAERRVRVFKSAPDFLDPHWHGLARGAPAESLDLWMSGEAVYRQGRPTASDFQAWFPSSPKRVARLLGDG